MGFWIASAVGLTVLWLFARDQFNSPSWNDEGRLTRILGVPELRGDRVRRRALLVYALLMSVLYAVIVFLVSSGALGWESIRADNVSADQQAGAKSVPSGGGGTEDEGGTLPEPWVPLAVSLAMIGIAPRSKLLVQVEAKLREKAHEMMGLPSGLFSAGQAIADAELILDDIGRDDVLDDDIDRLAAYCGAAGKLLPEGRVIRLEQVLLKLLAYKVWVTEGDWPQAATRKPYAALESEIATDLSARLADLDDLANTSADGLPLKGRDALIKRWDDRIRDTRKLCGEICVLMFIYSEKDDPRAGAGRQRIAAFFSRATNRKHTAPELDILINSLIGAVLLAAIGGYLSGMFALANNLPSAPPARSALSTALNAFFMYAPAMLVALWWHGQTFRPSGEPAGFRASSGRRYLTVFAVCFVASWLCLVALNISTAALGFGIAAEQILAALKFAFAVEAPMAALGGIQGVFVALYLDVRPGRTRSWGGWAFIAANVAVLVVWAAVATQLVVSVYGRAPAPMDFILRVPLAGLMGLIIALVLVWALAGGSSDKVRQLAVARAGV